MVKYCAFTGVYDYRVTDF